MRAPIMSIYPTYLGLGLSCIFYSRLHDVWLTSGRLITSLPSVEIEQDPAYTAKSSLSKPIGVPESAMSVSRAFRKLAVSKAEPSKSHKRRKHTASNGTLSSVETIVSDDEDSEDLNFLFSDDESVPDKGQGEAEKLATL